MTPPIPATLDEAVDYLLRHVPPDLLARFKDETRQGCIIGFSWLGGMNMRNAWGLWHGSTPLSKQLRAAGILHGDDASAIIFRALWSRLNSVPFDLATEAAYYKAWWAKRGCNPDGSPIPGAIQPTSFTLTIDKHGTIIDERPNTPSP